MLFLEELTLLKWPQCPKQSTDLIWSRSNWQGFPGGSVVKNLPANAGDTGILGAIHQLARFSGGGNGNLFQYSFQDAPTWAKVHGVTELDTTEWLSMHAIKLPVTSSIEDEHVQTITYRMNRSPLCSMGNYGSHPVIGNNGKGCKKMYNWVTCCRAKINTLYINYILQ